MSTKYFSIDTQDLDVGLIAAWRSIQEREPRFESPYFCPEFTRAVGSVRDDVRVVVIENDGRPAGFFPHQRAAWARQPGRRRALRLPRRDRRAAGRVERG